MTKEEVIDRLKRRFGLGTKPQLRLALYERLGRMVDEEGEEVLHVISTVAEAAAYKREPDKYFAWVIIRRLQDRGLIPAPEL